MKAIFLLFFNKAIPLRSVGLLLGLIFINLPVLAQPVSQEKFPTYDSQISNGGGTSVWINAPSIYADDNAYTYNELKEATSNTLNTYDYGFSIPSGATIQGIKVSMGRFGTSGSQISDAIVRLRLFGNYIGENKAVTTETWNENEIETLKEYGGETDLWGTTLTAEDINTGNIGLDIAVSSPNYGSNIRAFIDYVKITIYYVPLDPSYCAGAAVVLLSSNNTLNAGNSVGAPDEAVAKLIDNTSFILLDLTGEVTPRPQGDKVRIRLRDADPNDGATPWLYYRYATTRSASVFNWSSPNVYQVNSATLVDAEIPVGANTRYLMLEVAAYFNLALEIDAVTYDCPCSGATITSVTATPAVMCPNTSTTFSVTGDLCGADHWAWYQYSCGGTPIGTGETINYTPYPGTRTFYVRAEGGSAGSGGTCSSVTVTVYDGVTASITGGEQFACVSTTLTATTNATSPVFAWYKDDILMEGQTAQTLVVTQPGSYKVKVTSATTGCERTSYAFTVNSVSTMPSNRDVFASQLSVCSGSSVNIGITSAEEGVYYRLRKGDEFISDPLLGHGWTMYLPTGPLTTTTTINVLAIKGNCTLEMENKLTIEVGATAPTITSVTAEPATICWKDTTTLSVTGDLGSADHWAWYQYSCGGTPVGTGSSINITPYPGTYTYYVRGEGGCLTAPGACSSTTVTINEWPTASITGGEQNACVSTTLTATTNASSPGYAWYKDDVLLDGQSGQTLVVTQTGSYKVKVTNTATGCERTSSAFPVNSISTMPLNKAVFADQPTVCPGARVNIGIRSSEGGVYYRLRNDMDDSYIGDAVLGLNGVTIYLTAENLTQTTTFNVIAIKGNCVLEMADKPTVTVISVEPAITEVAAVPAAVCQGMSSTLSVTGSLGSATAWKWYSGSCGGTLVGTGESITVSPTEATTYYVRGEGGCATSGAACSEVSVAVNPLETPSVTITSSDADNKICFGTEVIFTATPQNTGDGTVTYTWIYNGIRYEVWDKNTLLTTELEDGDKVSCEITVSGNSCLTTSTVNSNEIITNVYDPYAVPSVTIESDDADNTICQSTLVTFTATPANTNGGMVSYQWYYNDYTNEGWNGQQWSYNELEDGDVVKCKMTVSGAVCYSEAEIMSNAITISVISSPVPWVSIVSSDADNTICPGTSVTFTATAENTGGGLINYQWLKNGANVGLDQNTYTCTDLADNDVVKCLIYVTEQICNNVGMGISNEITTTLMPSLEPWVNIVSSDADNTICSGTSVTFTATAGNTGEGTVAYQWKNNGLNVGTNQNTLTLSTLADKDAVSCEIAITGGNCLTTPSAASNVLILTVNQCCVPGKNDPFEPNNTMAVATAISTDMPEISANILNAKDQDWFKLTTSKEGYYTINLNPNGGKEDVELLTSKGQKLRPGSKTGLTYYLQAKTTYYIKIYDTKLKIPSPCYSLSVGFSPMMPAGGYLEANLDLKVGETNPVAQGIIKIWPNPTKHQFELYNGNETQVQVRVLDAYGRTIETIKQIGPAETVTFGEHYAPGIYLVETSQNGIPKIFKVVKH
jgi:hypothetical protein